MVTPLGKDTGSSWKKLLESNSVITKLEGDDYSKLPSRIAAQISPDIFNFEENFTKSELRSMSKSACLALVAAKEALTQVSSSRFWF